MGSDVATEPSCGCRRDRLPLILLAALAVALYLPACDYGFVNYDDCLFVTERPEVLGGLNPGNVWWALSWTGFPYYIPTTWLSYQLDATLWGTGPAGFHTTNVVLHVLNGCLAYLVFRALGGPPWAAAAAAALWLAHPQRVESVVWVSERKGLLSCAFGLLAVLAYVRYTATRSAGWMVASTGLLVTSLAAKPFLLTFPFALLLLDYFPLRRLTDRASVRRAVVEKIPMFALVVAWGAAAFVTQVRAGAATEIGTMDPLTERIGRSVEVYGTTTRQAVWPAYLAILYPRFRPQAITAAVAAAVLIGITAAAARRSITLVGWLWFLGTMVPVVGVVATYGPHDYADRNTYWPHLGLVAAVVFGLGASFTAPTARRVLVAALAVVLTAFEVATRRQVEHWQSDARLWGHTVAATAPDSHHLALALLANAEYARGEPAAALTAADAALAAAPDLYEAQLPRAKALYQLRRIGEADAAAATALAAPRPNKRPRELIDCWMIRGSAHQSSGQLEQAVEFYRRAAELATDFWEPHFQLGTLFAQGGNPREAVPHLEAARKLAGPSADPRVLVNLGRARLQSGSPADAIEPLSAAAAGQPQNPHVLSLLAEAHLAAGHQAEAAQLARRTAALDPAWAPSIYAAAWRMATDPDPARRRGETALRLSRLLCLSATPPLPEWVDAAAAAAAETGDFDGAVRAGEAAAEAAARGGDAALSDAIRRRTEGYRQRQPYRGHAP